MRLHYAEHDMSELNLMNQRQHGRQTRLQVIIYIVLMLVIAISLRKSTWKLDFFVQPQKPLGSEFSPNITRHK